MKYLDRGIHLTTGVAILWLLCAFNAHAENALSGWKDKILNSGKVEIETLKDAQYPEVSKLRTIVVASFKGNDGTNFSNAFGDDLSSAAIKDNKIFTLKSVGIDGATSQNNMIAAAKRNNVDAVVFGEANFTLNNPTSFTQEKCVKRKNPFKCEQKKTAVCQNYGGGYVADIKVVRVSDGTIVYEGNKEDSKTVTRCSTDSFPKPSRDDLATAAKTRVIEEVRNEIIPRTEIALVAIKSRAKGLSKEDAQKFKGAQKFVKNGRFDRGCGVWADLHEKEVDGELVNNESIALLYNLGVCAEYQGDYETAGEYYTTADNLLTSPDKNINEALQRMEEAHNALEIVSL